MMENKDHKGNKEPQESPVTRDPRETLENLEMLVPRELKEQQETTESKVCNTDHFFSSSLK